MFVVIVEGDPSLPLTLFSERDFELIDEAC